ncbi:DUF1015 domain-containing protein [Thiohalorhabdus sp.]|uniref:DUF1015 domain-containing protein n=1 Tax=Thiohalorhabdus sp. TaxID=3094134 RepID=UPI002FC2C602
MALIRPIAGLRPAAGQAEEVVAPPYDVLDSEEARERAAGRPWSFLHISKPEIDLPQGTDPYADEVYAKAAENLERMKEEGVLVCDEGARYYAYRITMGEHVQTGLVVGASVAAYDDNRIRRHEYTRPAKEDDRVRQIEALNAETGPALLAYPTAPDVDALIAEAVRGEPDMDVTADDGVRHQVWIVADADLNRRITKAFDAFPALYVADGHHRSAAASRLAAKRREQAANPTGEESYEYFLAVVFPHHEMQILDYNRVAQDLNGLSPQAFLDRVGETFPVEPAEEQVRPQQSGEFGMYLKGDWYRLTLPANLVPSDPVARLDVSLLADYLIEPILGISDPRTDDRIDFVGGIRGLGELEHRVDSGEMAVAFALHPTSMEDLMAVAEAGEVMPPKSTWFEPKLADGLVSHVLD